MMPTLLLLLLLLSAGLDCPTAAHSGRARRHPSLRSLSTLESRVSTDVLRVESRDGEIVSGSHLLYRQSITQQQQQQGFLG